MRSLLFVAVWLQVWIAVLGYPSGAPTTKCGDMTPGHGVPAQSSLSPYTITISQRTFSPNQSVKVNIQGPEYLGLLLQARSDSGTDAVGTWGPPPANTKHLACSNTEQSAITHSNRNSKNNETTYTWLPPDSFSATFIRATVVANRTTFWVNLSSEQLTRAPAGGNSAAADPKMAVVFLTLLMSMVFQ